MHVLLILMEERNEKLPQSKYKPYKGLDLSCNDIVTSVGPPIKIAGQIKDKTSDLISKI